MAYQDQNLKTKFEPKDPLPVSVLANVGHQSSQTPTSAVGTNRLIELCQREVGDLGADVEALDLDSKAILKAIEVLYPHCNVSVVSIKIGDQDSSLDQGERFHDQRSRQQEIEDTLLLPIAEIEQQPSHLLA